MGNILDILQGNYDAASPWSAMYPSPLLDRNGLPVAPGQAPDASGAAAYGALGVDPSAMPMPTPPVSPFPQQQQAPTPPATGFGAGAAPFSFAGPGSNVVSPSQIARPAPAPAVAAAPPPVATDISSANAEPQASPIAVGNYQMPRMGAADDFETDDSTPANAAPTQGRVSTAPQTAPFSLGGVASGIGDRLGLAGKGLLGNLGLGPIGALAGGLGALVSGRPTDPGTIATQKGTATLQALVAKGAPIADVQAAANNPALMQALIQQYYGKDKFKVQQTGEDGMGAKTFQLFNESDGTFKPIPGATAGAPAGGGIGDMSKKGAEYLATVPTAQRNTIQMMLSGDLPPPTSFAMAKPYWQNMIAAARNVDPNFTETNWAGRVAMARSAQGDGKMGQNNNAIVTGIGHLMQLNDAIPALNNSEHSQTYNRVSNAVSTEFGGTGATNFAAVANRVAPEIVRIWRGAGGAEADIKRDIDSLNTAQTPSQLHGALANIAGMMRSKLESNQQEYRATMGRDLPMTPQQQQTLSLLDRIASGGAAPAAAPPGALPAGWSVKVH